MLMESIVRRTLAIKDHRVVRITQNPSGIRIELDHIARRRLPCSHCGCSAPVRDRLAERSWTHSKLWGIPVTVVYRPCRVRCPRCNQIRVEAIPGAAGKSPLTLGLAWLLAALAKLLAGNTVARLMGVHWNTVAAAARAAVARGLEHRRPNASSTSASTRSAAARATSTSPSSTTWKKKPPVVRRGAQNGDHQPLLRLTRLGACRRDRRLH